MFESADGLMVPATRQKPGMFWMARPSGGVKAPAGTAAAVAMVVSLRASLARSSQLAAVRGRVTARQATMRVKPDWNLMVFLSLCLRTGQRRDNRHILI